MTGPSSNLSWKELACKDGTPYPVRWRETRAIELAEVFELIRLQAGDKPIKVLSAFRTDSWNRKIAGAPNSQHLHGRALDLQPPSGVSVKTLYELIRKLSKITKIRGIGRYRTFVHVDIRPSERLVLWSGHAVKDSLT